jgi:plastocyanin
VGTDPQHRPTVDAEPWDTACVTGVRRSATLLLGTVAALGAGGPALAAERVVQIGRDGVRPQVLQLAPGDTVRFVNDDPTFAYRAQSTGGPWRFDSGPTRLLEGDFVVPAALVQRGAYTYRVAQDDPFQGSVVVAGGGAATPAASPTAAAVPASPAPGAVAASPPAVPSTASPAAAPAVAGPLAGPPRSRGLGLAVAVAAVLVAGAASLLLRLLLGLPVLSDRPARL